MAADKKSGTAVAKKAASSSKNPAKKDTKHTNGKDTSSSNAASDDVLTSSASGGLSYPMLLGCLLVAALSFGAGVFTPPFLEHRKGGLSPAIAPQQTRKLAAKPIVCDEETLAQFIHEEPATGMHLVCVNAESNTLTLYSRLYEKLEDPVPLSKSWDELKTTLQDSLQLQTSELRQPWAIFTSDGTRKLVSADDEDVDGKRLAKQLRDAGMVLIMEGGNWLWPGVRVGFRRTIELTTVPGTDIVLPPRNATLETLSLKPLVVSVEGFLTDYECDFIQEAAMPNLKYSQVTLMDKDKGRPASDFRTSQSTFVRSTQETIKQVDYRTASLVRIPRSHQEHVQVLRYGNGEHYSAHHDYFNPDLYQNDPGTLNTIQNGRRNRLATVFWYLTDVQEGGETNFPLSDNNPYPRDLAKCTQGLMVKPQRGKVIIFYSLKADGDMDATSLHGACRVIAGVKFAANKWVWNAPMGHVPNE